MPAVHLTTRESESRYNGDATRRLGNSLTIAPYLPLLGFRGQLKRCLNDIALLLSHITEQHVKHWRPCRPPLYRSVALRTSRGYERSGHRLPDDNKT